MLSDNGKDLLTNKGVVIFQGNGNGKSNKIPNFLSEFFGGYHKSVHSVRQESEKLLDCKNSTKTIIVVGCARGGTSIVAGVLSSLGIFMGDNSGSPVFEDTKLAAAFESKNYQAANEIIDEYNLEHQIWGFKRPSSIDYLSKIHAMVRNPYYIIIFKDILAIGNRNSISMQSELIENMQAALGNYQKIIEFIQIKNPKAAMLVSAEKLLQHKGYFIEQLCIFLDLQVASDLVEKAEVFIEPNSSEYLYDTRITKVVGNVDELIGTVVKGWAKLDYDDNKPPLLEVYLNDSLILEVSPIIFRQDLLDSGIHKTGCAGFQFDLGKTLKVDDVLRIKAKYDVVDIFRHQF
jgi:hypothetical protein